VRWRGRSSEALLLLHFIAGLSLISTLLVIFLRYNENIITINSLDFCRFLEYRSVVLIYILVYMFDTHWIILGNIFTVDCVDFGGLVCNFSLDFSLFIC
jgi:hypothetical protein